MKALANVTSDKHKYFKMLKNNKNAKAHNDNRSAAVHLFKPLYFLHNEFI